MTYAAALCNKVFINDFILVALSSHNVLYTVVKAFIFIRLIK
jgi:hypothetical protein